MARTSKAAAEQQAAPPAEKPARRKAVAPAKAAKLRETSAPQRQAIVVLAMHRTGSSALTRVLNLLGCDTAKTLMGPNEHNKSGYWESDVLRVFNDQLLASAGSDWRDWRAFNPGWYRTPRYEEFLERGKALLAAEFGESRFFVFKDPRITRIMPFWRDLMARSGVGLRIILTLRHPLDVAASLMERDRMTEAEALLIWLRNVLEAERGSRDLPRVVVDYDRLLAAPSATMAGLQKSLGVTWPRLSDSVADEIDRFMSPALRHHKVAQQEGFAEAQMLRAWLSEVHGIFRRWAETGEDPADRPALDAVRGGMDALARPMSEVVGALTRLSSDVAGKDKELAYLRGEAGKRGDAVTALTAEKQALAKQLTTLGDAAAQVEARLQAELTEAQAAGAALRQSLTEREHEIDMLRGEAGKRGDAVTALTAEKQALGKQLEAAGDAAAQVAAQLRAELTEAHAAGAALRQSLTERESEIDMLRGEAGKRGDAVTALTADLATARQEAEAMLAERDRMAADMLEAARQEAAAALAERESIFDAAAERQMVELAGMARLLDAAEERAGELEQALSVGEAQRDAALAELRDECHVLRSALEQRSHERDETYTALARATAEAAEAATARAALEADLGQVHARFSADLAERDRALASQRQSLAALDAEVTTQARDLARLALIVIEKEEALKRRNAAAHEAEVQVGGLKQEIEGLRSEITGCLQELERLHAELETRIRDLADREDRIQAFLGSSSWRVTAPLRRLSLVFKR